MAANKSDLVHLRSVSLEDTEASCVDQGCLFAEVCYKCVVYCTPQQKKVSSLFGGLSKISSLMYKILTGIILKLVQFSLKRGGQTIFYIEYRIHYRSLKFRFCREKTAKSHKIGKYAVFLLNFFCYFSFFYA